MVGLFVCFCFVFISTSFAEPQFEPYRNLGYVVVTPNGPFDGGDFGSQTPGTKTAGIQEAIDYALYSKPQRNVWICGKQDMQTRSGDYQISKTIYIPPSQGFIIDGGFYLLGNVPDSGPVIHIDSSMNCRYRFGLIGCADKRHPAVLIKPEKMLPIDTWASPVVTVLDFRAEALLGGSHGLSIDATVGTIGGNTFYVNEIASSQIGLSMISRKPRDIGDNYIRVVRSHGNTVSQAQIGDELTLPESISQNLIDIRLNNDGIKESVGMNIVSASNNIIHILGSFSEPGKGLIFGPKAMNNRVTATSLKGGFTNNADNPTNHLIFTNSSDYNIETPAVPSSDEYLTNRYPFTIEVIVIEPGQISCSSVKDHQGRNVVINAPLTPGQNFILRPADSIKFTYEKPLKWTWRYLR